MCLCLCACMCAWTEREISGFEKCSCVGRGLEKWGGQTVEKSVAHKHLTGGGDQSAVVVTVSRGLSSAVVTTSRRSTSVQATCPAGQQC